ncbi:MAG: hypothetical protein U0414_24330 [Polyangiaceae bacterium]
MLHPDPLADPVERRAARARGAAMARLAHPNVVTVFDVGVDPATGQLFVAMERVSGSTLTAWRRAAPRTERAIVDVFLQAGRGLPQPTPRASCTAISSPTTSSSGTTVGCA